MTEEERKEKRRKYDREWKQKWREKNRQKDRDAALRYYWSHAEERKSYHKDYYQKNKEKIIEQSARWQRENAAERNAYNNSRRALKLNATPPWSDVEAIKEIYKACPKGFQVDHIYPLNSGWVCGLHTAENLQHLDQAANMKKFNRFVPEHHVANEMPTKLNGYPALQLLQLPEAMYGACTEKI